ncbi:ribonuclease 3-like, partial [Anopheles bellator]|uniref:ribonuclease 3-like n=1 Tax=Anopheles bellator TaxID=139047 RepID=UPI00264A1D3D
ASDTSGSSDENELDWSDENECNMAALEAKIKHPLRLHADLWHNDPGEMNDGPLCRCSARSQRTGIRHGKYPGEAGFPQCTQQSNNANKLHHYRITISPPTNFLTKTPTIIKHDQHEFLFEGFSLLAHEPIGELPTCKVIRFNIEYTILYLEEPMPENFTIRELDLFERFLFRELLELVDFSVQPSGPEDADSSCPCYHFLPRFVRDLPDNGKEVLAMAEVLRYLLDNSGPLVQPELLGEMMTMGQGEWQDYVDCLKGMVVTNPGMKPCSVRVDQLDRNISDVPEAASALDANGLVHPVIVHFGIRPPQLSYAGNSEYQKAWRECIKNRHLVANMSKPSFDDKRKLEAKENRLLEMRMQGRMKRNITIAVSARSFHRTGIMCDMVQYAMLIPVLTGHLRFHRALDVLERVIDYKFTNRYTLQLALTHPSYKENFGTNPDHARNSLTNCGIRQPEYGDRKIHYMNTRKRGINTLISIMSRCDKECETDSNITHNERLEFLGDAVVEFITSIHLFHMFPDLEEGGLATYRAAIVQNQHLAVLAKKLQLEEFMLYAHGSDLCHELELRHALANCFEALMGALLLDGGIEVADRVFAYALYGKDDPALHSVWVNYPPHPLQEQEPDGDRHHIESFEMLKMLTRFEDSIGVKFRHIRLLARAFTDRSMGFTNLTLGSNQRLEFFGDTVLQLICSEYLYRHFPEHHEGHLSLLRSSLVNNRTQAVVCDDLGMTQYAVYSNPKAELKTKDRADLLEAFLGAMYVDRGLKYCEVFCQVCLFPRLQDFIMNQDWNDPKSKLQQCCLTLRTMDGGEPDIPVYKVIECTGPTNTRVYSVAVYFRGTRLACANGHSIQQAEMNAAQEALEKSKDLFPQLDHQKRVIAQSLKRQKVPQPGRSTGGDRGCSTSGTMSSEQDVGTDGGEKQKRAVSHSSAVAYDEPVATGTSPVNRANETCKKASTIFAPPDAERLPKQYQINRSTQSDSSDSSSDDSSSRIGSPIEFESAKRRRSTDLVDIEPDQCDGNLEPSSTQK